MISLTRLNGITFWLNAELIETVESTPDVVVTLTNGRKYVVRETIEEVVTAIENYRVRLFRKMKEAAADEL
ncbi:MAG: flagellar FlbD family protein [Firmicutes bacterium]|nr:flagellar FlbD family protein [Bacillota bacterium]